MRVVDAQQLGGFGVSPPTLFHDVDVENAAVGASVDGHADTDSHVENEKERLWAVGRAQVKGSPTQVATAGNFGHVTIVRPAISRAVRERKSR